MFLREFLDDLSGAENLHVDATMPGEIGQLKTMVNASGAPVDDLLKLLALLGCLPADAEEFDGVQLPKPAAEGQLPPLLRMLRDHPMGEPMINHAAAAASQRFQEVSLGNNVKSVAESAAKLAAEVTDISQAAKLDELNQVWGVGSQFEPIDWRTG